MISLSWAENVFVFRARDENRQLSGSLIFASRKAPFSHATKRKTEIYARGRAAASPGSSEFPFFLKKKKNTDEMVKKKVYISSPHTNRS